MNLRKKAIVVEVTAILMAASLADVAQPVSATGAEMGRMNPMETFAPKELEPQKIVEVEGLLTDVPSTGSSIQLLEDVYVEEADTIEAEAEIEAKEAEDEAWEARIQAKAQEWQQEIARQEEEARRIAEERRRARKRAIARRNARIKERREIQKKKEKKELNSIKEFYWSLTPETDISKNLGISEKRFQAIMNSLPYDKADVFKNNALSIWKAAKKYDINEISLVGIMAWESAWGTDPIAPNNFSSQRKSGSVYYSYSSPKEGIEVLARNLANNYLSEAGKYYNGKSLTGINTLYCETDDWSGGVCSCMKMVLKEYLNTVD